MSNNSGVGFFDNPTDCTCKNDEGNTDKFDNFWRNSGSCCDNLRLLIWIIFNFIFLLLVFYLWMKIRREKAEIQRNLEDFSPDDENRVEEDANSSNNGSMTERLNR